MLDSPAAPGGIVIEASVVFVDRSVLDNDGLLTLSEGQAVEVEVEALPNEIAGCRFRATSAHPLSGPLGHPR